MLIKFLSVIGYIMALVLMGQTLVMFYSYPRFHLVILLLLMLMGLIALFASSLLWFTDRRFKRNSHVKHYKK